LPTRLAAVIAAALAAMLGIAAPAQAARCHKEVKCDIKNQCRVVVVCTPSTPGGPGNGGPPSGPASCSLNGRAIPCNDPRYGWWSAPSQCYYKSYWGPIPKDDPRYVEGWQVYVATCPGPPQTQSMVFLPTPPPGFGGPGVSPQQLARRAVKLLQLKPPPIGIVPEAKPGSIGLVGMPVWMWTSRTPDTWGPKTVTASVPGLAVTATAKADRVVWRMGDGQTVTCLTPGTPYEDRYGKTDSPDCGYRYTRTSVRQPGHAYTVAATTYWTVDWAGGGETGTIDLDFTASTQIRVGELQVLVTH
jgi:hypothetical protein